MTHLARLDISTWCNEPSTGTQVRIEGDFIAGPVVQVYDSAKSLCQSVIPLITHHDSK